LKKGLKPKKSFFLITTVRVANMLKLVLDPGGGKERELAKSKPHELAKSIGILETQMCEYLHVTQLAEWHGDRCLLMCLRMCLFYVPDLRA
jgi:hypothetical protein